MRLTARLAALVAAALLLLVSAAPPPAAAQTPPAEAPPAEAPVEAPAAPADPQALRDLLATLEDDAARQEFLDTLRAALQAQEAAEPPAESLLPSSLASGLLAGVSDTLGKVSGELAALVGVAERLPRGLAAVEAAFDTPEERAALALAVARGAIAGAAGLLGYALVRRLLRRPRRALQARHRNRMVERVTLLVGRLLLAAVPPFATVLVAWAALPLIQARPITTTVTIVIVTAYAIIQAVLALAETLFAPADDTQRVLPIGGETAHYLMLWVRRFTLLAVVGAFGLEGAALLGTPPAVVGVLQTLLGLLLAAMAVIFILQNRRPVAALLRRGTQTPPDGRARRRVGQRLRERLADVWHVLAALYVGAAFIIWAAEVPGGFLFMLRATTLSALVIVAALALTHGLELGLRRVFHISDEAKASFPGLEKRANRYVPLLGSILRGFLWLVAGLTVLQVWGLDTLVWLTTGGGQRLTSAVVTIGLVLLFSVVVWELVSSKIERYFSETDADGNVVERSARAKTLLPLLRNVLLVALIIVVTLIILSEVGVNIAPLLAGAGVVGLAIGFGSQKLVQDVITGAFILFEDTMAVGDVVQVGSHAGLVEGLTIRSMRLRDLSGSVHTVPFSSVDVVVNLTKDFSYYLMEIGVAYREDTDEVAAVLNEIADEMRGEDYYGPLILEPLEILGVDKFADSAVILKARIKTLPIRQWEVGREFNRRMKKAFDARSIEIPFPHRTLYFGVDKQGDAPPARVRLQDRTPMPDDTLAPPTPLPGPQTSDTPDPDH